MNSVYCIYPGAKCNVSSVLATVSEWPYLGVLCLYSTDSRQCYKLLLPTYTVSQKCVARLIFYNLKKLELLFIIVAHCILKVPRF